MTSSCMIDAYGVASTIIWCRMAARYVSGSTTAMGYENSGRKSSGNNAPERNIIGNCTIRTIAMRAWALGAIAPNT